MVGPPRALTCLPRADCVDRLPEFAHKLLQAGDLVTRLLQQRHQRAADDDAIGNLRYPPGLIRSGYPEPHAHRQTRQLFDSPHRLPDLLGQLDRREDRG